MVVGMDSPYKTKDNAQARRESPFQVPPWLDCLGALVERHRRFWLGLGRLETKVVTDRLQGIAVRLPIYVCGLARSGSTLLHEVIAAHATVATHRIKDYPMIFTPYWWRRATAGLRPAPPRERPHGDRLTISTESPDALEEMLWMAFFPSCHSPSVSNILDGTKRHAAFEGFYDSHLRKLLLAEGKTRYAAKANYHIARLAYLVQLFPDVRFIIPVRAPESHVMSLMRQQQRFSQGQHNNPRALSFMRRSGHFEFGKDRRPMCLGDPLRAAEISQAWAAGDEVRGLAMYWDMVYGYLGRLFAINERVRKAAFVVRYEQLCNAPSETLRSMFAFCQLTDVEELVARISSAISYPTYYSSCFSDRDRAVIRDETQDTASLWGY